MQLEAAMAEVEANHQRDLHAMEARFERQLLAIEHIHEAAPMPAKF